MFIKNSTDEQLLIKGCIKKDPKSQRLLYEKFAGKMYAICLRYIQEETTAEDVLIKGFTKIFEKIEQYKGDGSFEGWMRRVMVNESLQYIRKNKNMHLTADIETAHQVIDFEAIESQMAADNLLKIIGELPDGYRTTFNLYAIEGYSHQEIADMLNISVNTSKSQLSRARALLRKALTDFSKVSSQENTISHEG